MLAVLQAASVFVSQPSTADCLQTVFPPRTDISQAARDRRAAYGPLVIDAACRNGLSPHLLDALIIQESRYNQAAISSAGAIGLGQLMPGTARELGVDPYDPAQNIEGAARYLQQQLAAFGSVRLALAAYNAGPGRVRQAGRVPNIRETRNYVAAIERSLGGSSAPLLVQIQDSTVDTAREAPPSWDVFARFAWEQSSRRGAATTTEITYDADNR